MAGAAAAALYSQLAGRKSISSCITTMSESKSLKKPRRVAHRLAGRVHKGLRL